MRNPMPASAMPSISNGLDGSPVLVDGRTCAPAPAGVAVRAAAAVGAAVGADVPIGVAVGAIVGVCVALACVVAAGRVPAQGALGMLTMNSHGGNVDAGAVGPLQVDVRNLSLINETKPMLASALP